MPHHQQQFEESTASSLVSQCDRDEPAVEKIIHLAGAWPWKTRHRPGVRPIDILVACARNEEADAGSDDDVFGQERSPLKSQAAIQSNIVARVIGEQHLLGHFRLDGPNVIHVHERLQLRRDIRVRAIADDERTGIYEI